MELKDFFAEQKRAALAFSGGCDSAYLLYAAKRYGAELCAYYVHSPLQPAFELRDAKRLAEELGAELRVLEADVLADENVRRNPAERCYYCKKHIFTAILKAAREDGFFCVIDGTNASDDAADRPGMRALRELQVRSPLRECGITKAQVRALSREAGLFTWNKPAYACLATRIPVGRVIERETLAKIERGEAALADMGFSDLRLRIEGEGARLELTQEQLGMAMERREEILAALEADFSRVSVDLRPRRGS